MSWLRQRIEGRLDLLKLIYAVMKSPKITIDCFGDEHARSLYQLMRRPHPRLPLIPHKSFGVCLRKLEGPKENMFAGHRFELMRRKFRRAEKLGYTARIIDATEYCEEILLINTSTELRQGQKVAAHYLNLEKLRDAACRPGPWFGVFDQPGKLCAYCHTPIFGDAFLYARILGHAGHLENGIMYLLIRDTTYYMAEQLAKTGGPHWAMYDTYIGGSEGLRGFKRRTGFEPARVSWRWRETCGERSATA